MLQIGHGYGQFFRNGVDYFNDNERYCEPIINYLKLLVKGQQWCSTQACETHFEAGGINDMNGRLAYGNDKFSCIWVFGYFILICFVFFPLKNKIQMQSRDCEFDPRSSYIVLKKEINLIKKIESRIICLSHIFW